MTTDIETLPCGTVQVKVCSDDGKICCRGWVSSFHLTQTKENQLKEVLVRELKNQSVT